MQETRVRFPVVAAPVDDNILDMHLILDDFKADNSESEGKFFFIEKKN